MSMGVLGTGSRALTVDGLSTEVCIMRLVKESCTRWCSLACAQRFLLLLRLQLCDCNRQRWLL
jgi:hypothetical protein